MLFYGAALFLFLLFTDFLDGYLARKYKISSKFGTYFDATTDFILVFSLLLAFGPEDFYAEWIPILVATVFAFFILTSYSFKITYDPMGKYYGSILYGATGLRFIFSGEFFYYFITIGILLFSAASVLSRIFSIMKNKEPIESKEDEA